MNARAIRSYAERMAGYHRVLEARSTTTPAARLRALAGDEIRPVRVWTARNHNTPADALDQLTEDADISVRWNALLHPRTPAQSLQRLAHEEQEQFGNRSFLDRRHIAHHPNTPETLRHSLFAAGACPDCSPTCHGWHVYSRRPGSWYRPAGLFRRTPPERADQHLSWQRDDQAFFASGACHILAWTFMELHPDAGYEIHVLRVPGEAYPHHVYVSDGRWAFDHCGWTLAAELREAYEADDTVITSDLDTFCAENNHRRPEQFAHLPQQRAHDFIARFV